MIDSPNKYQVLFFTQERQEKTGSVLDDFTNWVPIPPPDVTISPIPNSVDLRIGDEKTVLSQVNSTTGFEPIVHQFPRNVPPNVKLTFEKNDLHLPSYGTIRTSLKIKALQNASVTTPISQTSLLQYFITEPASFFAY